MPFSGVQHKQLLCVCEGTRAIERLKAVIVIVIVAVVVVVIVVAIVGVVILILIGIALLLHSCLLLLLSVVVVGVMIDVHGACHCTEFDIRDEVMNKCDDR